LSEKRPLWDIVVIVLSIGGLALSATTLLPTYRRLARQARHAVRALAAARRPQSGLLADAARHRLAEHLVTG
jgi:hypothetical protein